MHLIRSVVLSCGCLLFASVAHAESAAKASSTNNSIELDVKPDAAPESTTQALATTSVDANANAQRSVADAAGRVRRDPKGKKGISPFWETVRRGDVAARERDFAGAEAAYDAAIGMDPKSAIAQLRKGQVLVRAGRLADAEAAYQVALQLADNATLHAAALFVLADLKERQGKRDDAVVAWGVYSNYLKREATAKGYPETAVERDMRLKTYAALAADSMAVRGRIELRLREVDEANKRRAAKNPNEGR